MEGGLWAAPPALGPREKVSLSCCGEGGVGGSLQTAPSTASHHSLPLSQRPHQQSLPGWGRGSPAPACVRAGVRASYLPPPWPEREEGQGQATLRTFLPLRPARTLALSVVCPSTSPHTPPAPPRAPRARSLVGEGLPAGARGSVGQGRWTEDRGKEDVAS